LLSICECKSCGIAYKNFCTWTGLNSGHSESIREKVDLNHYTKWEFNIAKIFALLNEFLILVQQSRLKRDPDVFPNASWLVGVQICSQCESHDLFRCLLTLSTVFFLSRLSSPYNGVDHRLLSSSLSQKGKRGLRCQ